MKVAVLGYGTVGVGVYEMLQAANVGVYEMLQAAKGLEAGPVLVRPGKENEAFKVSSIEKITGDPSVDAVAEVMGGVEPAFTYAMAAIRAGKHFVTSNKALVAAKGVELNRAAREAGVSFLFSAACGGGVPILHNLARAVQTDEILSVGGILNGTTNFMLDQMQSTGKDYADALKEAQELGYAEADPTADVTGRLGRAAEGGAFERGHRQPKRRRCEGLHGQRLGLPPGCKRPAERGWTYLGLCGAGAGPCRGCRERRFEEL